MVHVKNSGAAKETEMETEQLNLVTFHTGNRSSQQEAISLTAWYILSNVVS